MMSLPEKMKKTVGLEAKSSFSRSRCTGEIDNTWTESPAEREKREQVNVPYMGNVEIMSYYKSRTKFFGSYV